MLGSVASRLNSALEGLAMMPETIHPHLDRVERTDPITGHTLAGAAAHPWLQEGDSEAGLRIYFESEDSRDRYAAIAVEHPEQGLQRTLSDDTDEGYDEG
jgi:hypothetical protein